MPGYVTAYDPRQTSANFGIRHAERRRLAEIRLKNGNNPRVPERTSDHEAAAHASRKNPACTPRS